MIVGGLRLPWEWLRSCLLDLLMNDRSCYGEHYTNEGARVYGFEAEEAEQVVFGEVEQFLGLGGDGAVQTWGG